MRMIVLFVAALAVAAPASGTDLSYDAVTDSVALRAEVGLGNWLLAVGDDRVLESFSFFVDGTGDLTYRTVVAEMHYGRLVGDAYVSDWRTVSRPGEVETVIPGGLWLDPSRQYVAYLVPQADGTGWAIGTTGRDAYGPVVGVAAQLYSTGQTVDLDLPYDADVAMKARLVSVPEPTVAVALALGVLVFVGRRGE